MLWSVPNAGAKSMGVGSSSWATRGENQSVKRKASFPLKAGIQLKRLDSPVSSTGQAYQVRNDTQSKGTLDALHYYISLVRNKLQKSFGFLGLALFFGWIAPLPFFAFIDLESRLFQDKLVISRIGLKL